MKYILIVYRPARGGTVTVLPFARMTRGDIVALTVMALQRGADYAVVASVSDDHRVEPLGAAMLAELPEDETVETACELAAIILALGAANDAPQPPSNWN